MSTVAVAELLLGGQKETRWIITAMIQHDLYHAGEINHLRSLHRRADHWAYAAG